MARTVDYYFTSVSPFSYLGHQRFAAIAAKHGARVNVKPIDLGKVFPASGGLPLKQRAPQRQAYRLAELRRWRDALGAPITLEPKFFPAPPEAAALLLIATDFAHGTLQNNTWVYSVQTQGGAKGWIAEKRLVPKP